MTSKINKSLMALSIAVALLASLSFWSYWKAREAAFKFFKGTESRLDTPKISFIPSEFFRVNPASGEKPSLVLWRATACETGNVCCDLGGAHLYLSFTGKVMRTAPEDLVALVEQKNETGI